MDIPMKTSYIDPQEPEAQEKRLAKVSGGTISLDDINEAQAKELKMRLERKGLSLDLVLDKYKKIVSEEQVKYKGSDVLKVLERVEELLGFKEKGQEQVQIRALVQSKSSEEITTTLIEITGRTQEYIKKLKDLEIT